MKKKLLIISSYKRPCGIAQYVEHLEGPLRRALPNWQVEIAPLPLALANPASNDATQSPRRILGDIAARARRADVVNLQFEIGLFGRFFPTILSRLKAIFGASKKVVITYHVTPAFSYAKKLRTSGVGRIGEWLKRMHALCLYKLMFRWLGKNPSKFIHIVHTRRDFNNFESLGIPADKIYHMPVSFLTTTMKRHYAEGSARARKKIDKRYGTTGKKILGCFGFIAPHKGIDVAMRALGLLPDDYVLLVVGGVNQASAASGMHGSYPQTLKKLAATKGLRGRVHFCGSLDDDGFIQTMSACDGILLPYFEVRQSASGPAALALDLCKPLYCSDNDTFGELGKYAAGAVTFFEVNNHVDLARKILNEDALGDKQIAARKKYAGKYNVEAMTELYALACRRLAAPVTVRAI